MKMLGQNAVSLLTGPHTHLDHLGVFSHLVGIPVIVTEPETLTLAQIYYPQIDVSYKDFLELSSKYLVDNFSVIVHSGRKMTGYFTDMISTFHEKKLRFVYCPHGNSDKEYTLKLEEQPLQDIVFVYGNHMLDLLKENGAIQKINKTLFLGNYRYTYYKEHQAFYDNLAEEKLYKKLSKGKKNLLYAPTFTTAEYTSSYFEKCALLIEQKPRDWNLIIKPHPLLEINDPAKVWHLLLKYEDREDIIFLTDFPPIYPLLQKCDAFIGDFSSVGYDFLTFNKPMFFFAPKEPISSSRGLFLHQCGMQIPEENLSNMYGYIEKGFEENIERYSSPRKRVYEYTFEKDVCYAKIRENFLSI
jgi:hypothetical protein